jgi:hypothetical protein
MYGTAALDQVSSLPVNPSQWWLPGKSHLRKEVCVVSFAKPKQSSGGLDVDGSHQSVMLGFRLVVYLIDADLIDPENSIL